MALLFLARMLVNRETGEMISYAPTMSKNQEYAYLDESAFDAEVMKSHELVIVEFGAEWCGGCRMMAPIVNRMSATYGRQIRVIRLDIDENRHLVERYGIRAKPTYLFVKNGEIVDHLIGPASGEDFETTIKRLLSGE
jgi:thioredoxin 1